MKFKDYLTISLIAIFVLFFSLWCFFIPTPDYSDAERRTLAKMPEVTLQSINSGEFAKEFEQYATERFPARDMWRSVKAYARLKLFMQKENNDLFVKDGHISKIEYPLNKDMLDYAVSLFSEVRQKHFLQNKVYFSVIPDKNRYIADLKIDYDELENYMYNKLPFTTPIPISEFLTADDYYFTDSHWKQENIIDVAKYIAESMGTNIPGDYKEHTLTTDFKGVYAGQSALICKGDTIKYLTNDIIDNMKITGADAVYDMKKADSKDPYEFFMSGNQPLIKLQNPNSADSKKLVIFRDSFASSLTPLLAQGYSEVTLVDLRYMNSALLEEFVDFTDADILFLYSASLLNNSRSMK